MKTYIKSFNHSMILKFIYSFIDYMITFID